MVQVKEHIAATALNSEERKGSTSHHQPEELLAQDVKQSRETKPAVHLYKLEAEECVADEEGNDEAAPSDAAEEGGEDVLNSQEPSQSETSDVDDETDPAVHLYNQRMRRQPVFPIQKLLHRVGILHET